jgi:hypothetical protein
MPNIQELEQLERFATPGPWEFVDGSSNEFVSQVDGFDICALPGITTRKHDFRLIAAMRNAFPEILAKLKAAEKLAADVRALNTAAWENENLTMMNVARGTDAILAKWGKVALPEPPKEK